ncbi:GNAT family N-acetyltransferase [Mycobacterium sp. 050134]|uniref:GNAT family N-acetyltransferase n=1 Tax=Mycobacterium sp. 050134 TaxID=3096111 RepID=UPI002ED899C1
MKQPHDQRPSATDPTVVVRSAAVADIGPMTGVLTAAFAKNDPFNEWLFPDPALRARSEPRMFAAMIRHRFIPQDCALVASIGGRIVGALLWNAGAPGFRPIHAMLGGISLLAAMGSRVSAGMAMDAMVAALDPGRPHAVGIYLGCAPDVQRRGVGRALVNALAARCDHDDVPLYLMCKDANVGYYGCHGFEVVKQARLGNDGPLVNVMVRQPNRP